MAAGGKTEHADALRVNAPLLCVAAHKAERTLRVWQRRRVFLQTLPLRHAILQEDAGDADRIEPLAHLRPFQVQREDVVAAARTNNHGRARVPVRRRTIDGDRRPGHVAEPDDRLARDQSVGPLRHVALLADVTLFARRALPPKLDDFRWLRGEATGEREKSKTQRSSDASQIRFHALE